MTIGFYLLVVSARLPLVLWWDDVLLIFKKYRSYQGFVLTPLCPDRYILKLRRVSHANFELVKLQSPRKFVIIITIHSQLY